MDSLKSFKGYGKMDPAEDRMFRRKTKIRFIFIAVAVVLLVAIVAGVAISVSVNKRRRGDSSSSPQLSTSASSSIKAVCSVTRYPDSCFASLSSAISNSSTVATDPTALFQLSLAVASRSLSKLSSFLFTLKIPTTDSRLQAAINDCKELLDDAIDRLNDSTAIFTTAKHGEKILSDSKISDLKTWLSTTITNQETCLDGFEGTTGGFRENLEAAMVNSTQFSSNSLAIVTGVMEIMGKLHVPINRKLLATMGQSRVLLAGDKVANVTVAKDGSGEVKSIQEAVKRVPSRSLRPFVIYIKEGEYEENVVVDKNKWNVVMVGDGMYKTIITGNKNFIDGTPTFSTATFGEFH